MNIISVPGQSGRSYTVRIAGETPTPDEQARIDAFIAQREANSADLIQKYYGQRADAPEEDTGPDTSFLGAVRYGIDQPLEGIATTAKALGGEGIGAFLSNLTEAPTNYQSATEGFMNEDGSFFDLSYLPRAAVEQAGQFGGSILSRIGGAALGGAAGSLAGPGGSAAGAVAGAFLGPAVFEAAQLLGPIAIERARNNGRETPSSEDWLGAVAAASASGALNAIAPNLDGFLKRVLIEGGTEGLQSLIQQAGETAETNVGLQLDPRQAVGEAILGGGVAGAVLAPGAVMERRAKKAEEDKKALDELEEDQIEMAADVENRIKFGLEAIDNEPEFEAEPRRSVPTALLPNTTLNPQEEKVAEEAQARGQMDDLAKGNTVPTTQRTFELDQYDEAVRRIRELGRFSAPAIQSAVRKKTGAQVPMSVVRDIRDEMVRRGVLRADVASKEGYVLEPEKVEKFSEAESLQKTMDEIERAIEADRKERERAAQETRRLEQTGAKPSAVRAEALKVDAADARIAQAEATRAEVTQRIANVERSQRVPTQERPGSPVADGQMATAIADVSPEAQQVALQRQQQNLKASLDAYNERIKQQKAILSKLKAGAKKVQLPKSELAKMDTIQRGIEADTRAVEAIKKRMSNPSSDLQVAKEQAIANKARVVAEQAAKAAPPVYSGKEQAIFNALRKRLSNLGLSDVRLTAERMINPEAAKQGQLIEGMFDTKDGNRIISLALSSFDPSLDAKQLEQALAGVMNHEVIHALRNLGLFTDAEWRSLTELARRQKYMKVKGGKSVERAYTYFQRAQRMYPEGDAELHVEEAVAEMFRDYVDGKLKVGGKPKTLLDRIKNFFKAIRGAHVDAEIDPNTIFQGIQMGEIGRRERRPAQTDTDGEIGGAQRLSVLKVDGKYDRGRMQAIEDYHRERAITKMDESGNTPDRISTRQPYTKRATENPITQDLRINLDAMKASDKAFTHNMNVLKGYPGFVTTSEDPNQIAEDFMSFVEDNLIWLHNSVPNEIRGQSKLWYDGARRITENWSGQYDVPDYVVAGVLASLSPQKDWYQNVSLAERVLDIHTNFTTGDNVGFVPSDEMAATAKRIYGKDKYAADLIVVLNTPYSQINDEQQQAMWLRIYDETYNPRGYRTVSADGQFVGDASGKVAWGSNVEIGKAIYALKNQNRASVSAAMGEMHKVRNFFNNILAPKADAGDVTIDTHAVAAALLRPLSGSSTEVHHNFGSTPEKNKQKEDWVPIKNIGDSGSMGTYGIYADAYRRAAEKLGILPRELQSITWEAVRGLFPAVDKRNKGKVAQVNEEWKKVSDGSISTAEARENIRNIMGGINEPTWYGLDYSEAGATAPSSYEGELAVSRLNRGYRRSVSGTSERDAARTGGTTGRSGAASADVSGRTPGAAARGGPAGGSSRAAGPRQSVSDAQPGRAGDGGRRQAVRSLAPLEGAPNVRGASGPDPRLIEVAEEYARSIGIDLKRQSEFVEVDEDRARRIAAAYDEMKDDPQNPQVKEAYENLIKQTVAQYRALEKAGYKFWFIDTDNDNGYSESPWNAMRDLRANKRMGVFPTTSGYGTGDFDLDPEKNPLLADTGIKWPWGSPNGPPKTVLANDLFRAVHDAFGHGLEGAGFRARGEENAWQAHIRLFTGSAQGAITSETRGQNSWLNYGPYGEQNRTAKVEDTIFAEQKIGLMPEWTWKEGRAGDMEFPDTGRYSRLSAVPALSRSNYQNIGTAQKQVMYARSADVLAKVLNLRGYGLQIEKAREVADKIIKNFQDNMLPVGRMIQDLAKAGLTITDAMDTYLKEELFHGIVGDRVTRNQRGLYEPTAQAIKSLNVSDAEIERLRRVSDAASPDGSGFLSYALKRSPSKRIVLADAYLYAKHAKERNKFIKDVRDPANESGSGMTDAEADAILNWFNSLQGTNRQAIANIERNIRAIVADTNRTRLDAGLISQEVIDDGTGWQFYVPLRGIFDPEEDRNADTEEGFSAAKGGPGFGARGKEDPNALGRYGPASNLVANVFAQNQSAIVRAERNKVGQSFLKLLRADPTLTGSYAEVLDKVPMRRVTDSTGKNRMVPDQTAGTDPMMLVVKENGKQTYVRFKDARIASAMNGQNGYGPSTGRVIINAMSKINRYLASINTSYNPEFMITNAFRDLQAAGVNVNQYEKEGLTRDVVSNAAKAVIGIKRSIINKDDSSEWSKVYRDFVAAGGQNATNQINTLSDQIENIEGILGDIAEDGMRGKWAKMKNSLVGRGASSLLDFVENLNTAIENGVRVATYKALLDRGFTRERAAQAARNVTANFAKGGDHRIMMNAFYLFYNASIQGTFAMLNAAVRSPKVRKLWAGVLAAGAAQELMNAFLSGEDEDGQLLYDKIPDYVKERNIIFMDPLGITGRGYITIPMPYGLNMAHTAGRNFAATFRGVKSPGEAAMNTIAVAVDVLNPIGGTESFLNMIAPTVADPIVDIYENEDYADKPIYKEGLPFDRTPSPSSQMYWNSTSPSAIWITDNLNSLTGGNAARSGLIDFSPDVVQYWFEFLTGGVGRFALNSVELPFMLADQGLSEDLVRSTPFLRRGFGSVSEREDVGLYMERASRVLMAGEELKQAREAGDGQWARETIQKYPNELRMLGQVKAFETALRKISRQMNEVEKNSRISPEQKARIMDALDKRKQNILMNANRILYRLE